MDVEAPVPPPDGVNAGYFVITDSAYDNDHSKQDPRGGKTVPVTPNNPVRKRSALSVESHIGNETFRRAAD